MPQTKQVRAQDIDVALNALSFKSTSDQRRAFSDNDLACQTPHIYYSPYRSAQASLGQCTEVDMSIPDRLLRQAGLEIDEQADVVTVIASQRALCGFYAEQLDSEFKEKVSTAEVAIVFSPLPIDKEKLPTTPKYLYVFTPDGNTAFFDNEAHSLTAFEYFKPDAVARLKVVLGVQDESLRGQEVKVLGTLAPQQLEDVKACFLGYTPQSSYHAVLFQEQRAGLAALLGAVGERMIANTDLLLEVIRKNESPIRDFLRSVGCLRDDNSIDFRKLFSLSDSKVIFLLASCVAFEVEADQDFLHDDSVEKYQQSTEAFEYPIGSGKKARFVQATPHTFDPTLDLAENVRVWLIAHQRDPQALVAGIAATSLPDSMKSALYEQLVKANEQIVPVLCAFFMQTAAADAAVLQAVQAKLPRQQVTSIRASINIATMLQSLSSSSSEPTDEMREASHIFEVIQAAQASSLAAASAAASAEASAEAATSQSAASAAASAEDQSLLVSLRHGIDLESTAASASPTYSAADEEALRVLRLYRPEEERRAKVGDALFAEIRAQQERVTLPSPTAFTGEQAERAFVRLLSNVDHKIAELQETYPELANALNISLNEKAPMSDPISLIEFIEQLDIDVAAKQRLAAHPLVLQALSEQWKACQEKSNEYKRKIDEIDKQAKPLRVARQEYKEILAKIGARLVAIDQQLRSLSNEASLVREVQTKKSRLEKDRKSIAESIALLAEAEAEAEQARSLASFTPMGLLLQTIMGLEKVYSIVTCWIHYYLPPLSKPERRRLVFSDAEAVAAYEVRQALRERFLRSLQGNTFSLQGDFENLLQAIVATKQADYLSLTLELLNNSELDEACKAMLVAEFAPLFQRLLKHFAFEGESLDQKIISLYGGICRLEEAQQQGLLARLKLVEKLGECFFALPEMQVESLAVYAEKAKEWLCHRFQQTDFIGSEEDCQKLKIFFAIAKSRHWDIAELLQQKLQTMVQSFPATANADAQNPAFVLIQQYRMGERWLAVERAIQEGMRAQITPFITELKAARKGMAYVVDPRIIATLVIGLLDIVQASVGALTSYAEVFSTEQNAAGFSLASCAAQMIVPTVQKIWEACDLSAEEGEVLLARPLLRLFGLAEPRDEKSSKAIFYYLLGCERWREAAIRCLVTLHLGFSGGQDREGCVAKIRQRFAGFFNTGCLPEIPLDFYQQAMVREVAMSECPAELKSYVELAKSAQETIAACFAEIKRKYLGESFADELARLRREVEEPKPSRERADLQDEIIQCERQIFKLKSPQTQPRRGVQWGAEHQVVGIPIESADTERGRIADFARETNLRVGEQVSKRATVTLTAADQQAMKLLQAQEALRELQRQMRLLQIPAQCNYDRLQCLQCLTIHEVELILKTVQGAFDGMRGQTDVVVMLNTYFSRSTVSPIIAKFIDQWLVNPELNQNIRTFLLSFAAVRQVAVEKARQSLLQMAKKGLASHLNKAALLNFWRSTEGAIAEQKVEALNAMSAITLTLSFYQHVLLPYIETQQPSDAEVTVFLDLCALNQWPVPAQLTTKNAERQAERQQALVSAVLSEIVEQFRITQRDKSDVNQLALERMLTQSALGFDVAEAAHYFATQIRAEDKDLAEVFLLLAEKRKWNIDRVVEEKLTTIAAATKADAAAPFMRLSTNNATIFALKLVRFRSRGTVHQLAEQFSATCLSRLESQAGSFQATYWLADEPQPQSPMYDDALVADFMLATLQQLDLSFYSELCAAYQAIARGFQDDDDKLITLFSSFFNHVVGPPFAVAFQRSSLNEKLPKMPDFVHQSLASLFGFVAVDAMKVKTVMIAALFERHGETVKPLLSRLMSQITGCELTRCEEIVDNQSKQYVTPSPLALITYQGIRSDIKYFISRQIAVGAGFKKTQLTAMTTNAALLAAKGKQSPVDAEVTALTEALSKNAGKKAELLAQLKQDPQFNTLTLDQATDYLNKLAVDVDQDNESRMALMCALWEAKGWDKAALLNKAVEIVRQTDKQAAESFARQPNDPLIILMRTLFNENDALKDYTVQAFSEFNEIFQARVAELKESLRQSPDGGVHYDPGKITVAIFTALQAMAKIRLPETICAFFKASKAANPELAGNLFSAFYINVLGKAVVDQLNESYKEVLPRIAEFLPFASIFSFTSLELIGNANSKGIICALFTAYPQGMIDILAGFRTQLFGEDGSTAQAAITALVAKKEYAVSVGASAADAATVAPDEAARVSADLMIAGRTEPFNPAKRALRNFCRVEYLLQEQCERGAAFDAPSGGQTQHSFVRVSYAQVNDRLRQFGVLRSGVLEALPRVRVSDSPSAKVLAQFKAHETVLEGIVSEAGKYRADLILKQLEEEKLLAAQDALRELALEKGFVPLLDEQFSIFTGLSYLFSSGNLRQILTTLKSLREALDIKLKGGVRADQAEPQFMAAQRQLSEILRLAISQNKEAQKKCDQGLSACANRSAVLYAYIVPLQQKTIPADAPADAAPLKPAEEPLAKRLLWILNVKNNLRRDVLDYLNRVPFRELTPLDKLMALRILKFSDHTWGDVPTIEVLMHAILQTGLSRFANLLVVNVKKYLQLVDLDSVRATSFLGRVQQADEQRLRMFFEKAAASCDGADQFSLKPEHLAREIQGHEEEIDQEYTDKVQSLLQTAGVAAASMRS